MCCYVAPMCPGRDRSQPPRLQLPPTSASTVNMGGELTHLNTHLQTLTRPHQASDEILFASSAGWHPVSAGLITQRTCNSPCLIRELKVEITN